MPNLGLIDMTAGSDPVGDELLYMLQDGADRKVTAAQLVADSQPLDPTLTALSGLDGEAGFLYQTSPDSFIKTNLTPAHMVALRTFVKPYAAATNIGGGFFQANLFRLTLGSPDAASGQLVVHAKIIDVTTPKSGAFYYEVPICFQRDSLEVGGNIPSGLIRTHFDGSTGGGATSVGFFQGALAVSAPNIDISLVIQPVNFTNPAVSMSAVFTAPGDVAVTIL